MDTSFRLFPQQASTTAAGVDALFLFLVSVAVFFAALICVLILYFGVKYRRGSGAERANPPASYVLEVTWFVIPLLLTMVMFVWGAKLYFNYYTPPADAMPIDVVAKQWMWKIQHPEGRREINELHVPVGRAVRLKMISEDVIHSFFVPDFRVKMDVLPGRYTSLWFQPTRVGRHRLFCAEYCGTGHSRMIGWVIVQEPAEYADWLSGVTGEPPEIAGQRLFERHRCGTCHQKGPQARCPDLEGLFGKTVSLEGGGTVVADEDYIRESILRPQAKIVAEYQSIMPTFEGQLSEDQVFQLIAYIKSLSETKPPETKGPQTPPKP